MEIITLYSKLCSKENIILAFERARKHKTTKDYVLDFSKNLKENLSDLRNELVFYTYQPRPLETFILRDPKTRKISKSDFRDRIIHHALCNIIEPFFESIFIFDSYANRIGKGTLKAIERFDIFKRKVSQNYTKDAFVLKADIRHYFETVDHKILKSLIRKRIEDERVLWLINKILSNYKTKIKDKGMPLGNLTSQFFANVYLNELDQYAKHTLKAKYYIRYVDDFVILDRSKKKLYRFKKDIDSFLKEKLKLELHPDKSRIIPLMNGTEFLGMRIFPHHRLLRKKNLRKFKNKLNAMIREYRVGEMNYEEFYEFLEGWIAYAKNANTYNLRGKVLKDLEQILSKETSKKEVNILLKNSLCF